MSQEDGLQLYCAFKTSPELQAIVPKLSPQLKVVGTVGIFMGRSGFGTSEICKESQLLPEQEHSFKGQDLM